jgi:hypothetical protein
MKGITITTVTSLLALCLGVYGPWRTGGQVEKYSAGGLNAAQDVNRLAADARDVKQPVKYVQQSVKEVKQRVTYARGAKLHDKSVRSSTAGLRQDVKRQGADVELRVVETRVDYDANGCVTSRCGGRELRVVETPDVERLTVDVMRPAEDVEVVSEEVFVEVEEFSARPTAVEYVRDARPWPPARATYLAVPERQECPTPHDVRVEFSVR